MTWLETRIPPPLVAAGLAAAMWAASLAEPPSTIAPFGRAAAAMALFILAIALAAPALRAFSRAHTTHSPIHVKEASSLVTTSIYARTRNPMYLGLALLLAAWTLWLARWAPLLGPLIFMLFITRFQIMPEERALTARFGEEYTCYRRAVRRWL